MPDSPQDVLLDVSEGLKALSVLVEDWGDCNFPAHGVGVIIRILGRKVADAVYAMPSPET